MLQAIVSSRGVSFPGDQNQLLRWPGPADKLPLPEVSQADASLESGGGLIGSCEIT
jgi:hypothetical protein